MNSRFDSPKKQHPRRGATLVLAMVFIILMLAMVAFAVDIGYIVLGRSQLQVAADSAAMAAAATNILGTPERVRATAKEYAAYHVAGAKAVALDTADIEIGRWNCGDRTFDPTGSIRNAVRILAVDRESSLFFGRVLGVDSVGLSAEAVSAFDDNFSGFRAAPENLPLLPITLDKETWDALLGGTGTDNWTWDPETREVSVGADGVPEANLYPEGTGSPGNRGTVDIGSNNNSTSDFVRQILHGVNAKDLEHHGGKLQLDERGALELGGDPGISEGVKEELADIRGKPRVIPIFNELSDSGDNARYTIVEFGGICIVEVDMTGNDKRVLVQPANAVTPGGIPAHGSQRTSHFVVGPVRLVR